MLHTRLKKLRMEKDLTQAALARELNVTQQAVAKWEAGKSLPDHAMLLRLAQYYGVSVDYLLGLPAALPGDGFAGPVLVPVVGAVRAGYNAFAFEEHMGSEPAGVPTAGSAIPWRRAAATPSRPTAGAFPCSKC